MSKLIGILGGTFDPVHLGHLHLATTVWRCCQLEKIFMLPCFQSPLREQPIAAARDRLKMLQLATQDLPYLVINDYEIKRQHISYTIDTIKALCAKLPDQPLALIIGLDAFNQFTAWHQWQAILENTHLIIANRPGSRLTNQTTIALLKTHQTTKISDLENKEAGLIYLITINPLPISATMIRSGIKTNQDVTPWLPKKVWQYIQVNKLYGCL